jgi:hypothetical protein
MKSGPTTVNIPGCTSTICDGCQFLQSTPWVCGSNFKTNNYRCHHPSVAKTSVSPEPGTIIHFNHEGLCETPQWCPFSNSPTPGPFENLLRVLWNNVQSEVDAFYKAEDGERKRVMFSIIESSPGTLEAEFSIPLGLRFKQTLREDICLKGYNPASSREKLCERLLRMVFVFGAVQKSPLQSILIKRL